MAGELSIQSATIGSTGLVVTLVWSSLSTLTAPAQVVAGGTLRLVSQIRTIALAASGAALSLPTASKLQAIFTLPSPAYAPETFAASLVADAYGDTHDPMQTTQALASQAITNNSAVLGPRSYTFIDKRTKRKHITIKVSRHA